MTAEKPPDEYEGSCAACGERGVARLSFTMQAPVKAPAGHRYPGVTCPTCGAFNSWHASPRGARR